MIDNATNAISSIPFTAWQQAVFVVLFIILLLVILAWTSRENKTTREFQAAEAAAREAAQGVRDADWRLFLDRQRAVDQQMSHAVKGSLDTLTAITSALVNEVKGSRSDFLVHDQREWAKLDEMSRRVNNKPRARVRKVVDEGGTV